MTRACDAKPGDRTYDNSIVRSVTPLPGGNLVRIIATPDDGGQDYGEVVRADANIISR